MVRSLSTATNTAIANKHQILPRNFLWVAALDFDEVTQDFFFTDHGFNITINIINAYTGSTQSKNYIGDDQPFHGDQGIPPFPESIGLAVQSITVQMNMTNSSVENMFRGHQLRGVVWQLHRQFLNPATRKFVDTVPPRSWGLVKGSKITEDPEGGHLVGHLDLVTATQELTRTSGFMWSDESVRRARDGDRLLKWADNTQDVDFNWQVGRK